MKVTCPSCHGTLPAKNINLEAGWAKCEACNEILPLARLIPGFVSTTPQTGQQPVERPFNARGRVERTRHELLVEMPRSGMRVGHWAMAGFATFWLGFIGFWTLGALGVFFMKDGDIGPFNVGAACFSIPFWIVGFGMAGGVIWSAFSSKTVRLDRTGMSTTTRCLLWSRNRWIEVARVQCARAWLETIKGKDMSPNHGVEIVFEKGSYTIPTDSVQEQQWLIWEINAFLGSLRA